jgi:SPP1 gp7 family putative phage head morphogenesis protein
MVNALLKAAQRFARAVKAVLLHRIKDFARPPPERADAKGPSGPSPKALMKEARAAAKKARGQAQIDQAVRVAAERNVRHSEREFVRLGIDVRKEPALAGVIEKWAKDTAARLVATQDEQLDKVEALLEEGYGRSVESLTGDILNQVDDVTESRAEFVARDSILSLNGEINEARQTAADIESYVWTTSGDERVRPEHADLEGQEFTWESGGDPEEGHPGESYNCRCTAYPILPELDEEPQE